MRVARRVVLVSLVAAVWAGAGSAVLASPASAGGFDTSYPDGTGDYEAGVYNLTPYPWTLVEYQAPPTANMQRSSWSPAPAQTIPAGGVGLYGLTPNCCTGATQLFSEKWGYDGWMTYKVDILEGPPEYVTIALSQLYSNGIYGNSSPALRQFITTAPPPAGYDPGPNPDPSPAPLTASPQLTYGLGPTAWDLTYTLTGNYTVDASTPQGQPFVDILNAVCPSMDSGDPVLVGGSCSFTQATPITYGPGKLTQSGEFDSCVQNAPPPSDGQAPPDDDPNYAIVGYEAAQSASLSVGAGITEGVEGELFGVIAAEASVSVEAEHEWEDTVTYERKTKIYLSANTRGFIWVAPTVGRVTGTLVATIGSATFTAKNFTEVRSGVTGVATDPRVQPIPAFSVVTKTRPMTNAERSSLCGTASAASRRALKTRPPARLIAGRSVAHVALGDTDETVMRRLGWPAERSFPLNPCQGMEGCTAVRGLHGTFNYKKRKLSVVFGPDRRVAALIYSGNRSTKDGAGKNDTMARLRAEFPRISCAKFVHRVDCAVQRVSGQRTVRTVFRLTDRLRGAGTMWQTDEVLMYVERRGKGTV
jgi:hypothetical protein